MPTRSRPTDQRVERGVGTTDFGTVPHVDAMLDEARNLLRCLFGPERDDQGIAVEGAVAEPYRVGRRVDRVDDSLDHLDPAIQEPAQRPDAFFERMRPHDSPGLAEAHHELAAPIDEDDLIGSRQQAAQPGRGGDPAETSTEDDHPCHLDCLH